MLDKSNRARVKTYIVMLAAIILPVGSCQEFPQDSLSEHQYITVRPKEDATSVIRNPAMGWVLYADDFLLGEPLPQAAQYWNEQSPHVKYASIFYVRLPWSQLEPQEGNYAWENDQNYIDLIQGAIERGLKLAFRVYVDSHNCYRQAVPQYVRDAGAQGYLDVGNSRWSPYLFDSVFQAKFERFLAAFGAEYNDPNRVDYIDGNGLGWWGEGHHLNMPAEKIDGVFSWITETYAANFSNVLLGVQYSGNGGQFGWDNIDGIALKKYGYVIRKDTLGHPHWFLDADKNRIRSHFPQVPFFGENVYHSLRSYPERWQQNFNSLRELFQAVLDDALLLNANTLDLRIPQDAASWLTEAPDLVQQFVEKGGYRLMPVEITYSDRITQGEKITISHTWKNTGVGVLPNNRPQWNYKYKVAFALINRENQEIISIVMDTNAEPSDWIIGGQYSYKLADSFGSVPKGGYKLGYAIVDTTRGNTPAINLAIYNPKTSSGWYILGDITVH